jgi:hypothetical protein
MTDMGVKTSYKDVMDEQTSPLAIGHVRVKTKLFAQIRYILSPVNTVGWHGIGKVEVDFYANISSKCRRRTWVR